MEFSRLERVMERGARAAKVERWTGRLERYETSGQTVAEFCQGEGVAVSSFYRWKNQFASESGGSYIKPTTRQPSESAPASFQAVGILPAASSATTIRFPNGIEIELGSDLRVADLLVKRLLENVAGGH
jgi:hypothetical protein